MSCLLQYTIAQTHIHFFRIIGLSHAFALLSMSNTTYMSDATVDLSNQIKYIVMQTCHIPSLICSIFTLTHLLLNHHLRAALHNHIPLILLIVSTFDLLFNHPLTLNYLRISRVVPSTDAMCLYWNFINSIFTVGTYWTMAWGSFERHLLIFNSTLFTTRRGRVLFHYTPLLIMTFIYPIFSNIIIILLYPCSNQFAMKSLFCGFPCSLRIQSVALYTRIAHQFVPTFIVAGFAVSLIVRVIRHKQQVQHTRFIWRRYRRMIIQLLGLASLFLMLTLPATIVSIVQNCGLPTFAFTIQVSYLNFLVRFITIFMPFMCLSLLPEIWPKLLPCTYQAPLLVTRRVRVNPS